MLSKIREFLKGKKTYLVAVGVVIAAVISWSTGEVDLLGFAKLILEGIGLGSVRAAISKMS